MPIAFTINTKLELLYAVFHDKVNTENAFHFADQLYQHRDIKFAKKSLICLRESLLNYKIEEIEEFAYFISSNKNFIYRKKIAVLINTPLDTVAATIFAQTLLAHHAKTSVELFSTLEAALKFLELTENAETVHEIIQLFKTPKLSLT